MSWLNRGYIYTYKYGCIYSYTRENIYHHPCWENHLYKKSEMMACSIEETTTCKDAWYINIIDDSSSESGNLVISSYKYDGWSSHWYEPSNRNVSLKKKKEEEEADLTHIINAGADRYKDMLSVIKTTCIWRDTNNESDLVLYYGQNVQHEFNLI